MNTDSFIAALYTAVVDTAQSPVDIRALRAVWSKVQKELDLMIADLLREVEKREPKND